MAIRIPNIRFSLFSINIKKNNNRPKLRIPLTIFDLIMEIAGVVALIALWIIIIVPYSKLPDTIPTHFNSAGEANDFGSKNFIFILPVIATVTYIGFTILNRFPWLFNLPVEVTEHNAFMQYRNATRMVRSLKLILVLVFGFTAFHMIQSASGNAVSFGGFTVIILAAVIIPVIYYIVKSFIYK
jgi:uncharacterized membrane protein